MAHPHISLDNKLGAIFVGNIVAAVYGIHYSKPD